MLESHVGAVIATVGPVVRVLPGSMRIVAGVPEAVVRVRHMTVVRIIRVLRILPVLFDPGCMRSECLLNLCLDDCLDVAAERLSQVL